MVIGLAFLVCIVGLVLYLVAAKPEVKDVGRIMFAIALFVLLANSDKVLTLAK